MINNTDFASENIQELMFLRYGGAITFRGSNLYINDSFGKLNNGFRGGFLLVDSISKSVKALVVENSIFINNFAGNGGAFGFGNGLKIMEAYFNNNYFRENIASSN